MIRAVLLSPPPNAILQNRKDTEDVFPRQCGLHGYQGGNSGTQLSQYKDTKLSLAEILTFMF